MFSSFPLYGFITVSATINEYNSLYMLTNKAESDKGVNNTIPNYLHTVNVTQKM